MSPKLRPLQRMRKRPLPVVGTQVERAEERSFWVKVTHPENSVGLRPEEHLMLQVGDESVAVLRALAQIGVLEALGDRWVRERGYSQCVFVKYDTEPSKRFQVRIAAR